MADGELTVRVLGPLQVIVEGRQVEVSAGRLRAMLAVLAMSPAEGVSVDRLVGAVWGEELPSDPRRTVRTYITRLRRAVGSAAIDRHSDGYRLLIHPDRVDAIRFVRLLNAAARLVDPVAERRRLVQALALWRGAPFDGVPSPWLHSVEAPQLAERRLSALERRIELDLAMHEQTDDLVAELRALTARHPLRERLWAQLMTALYRSGRQADALEAYRDLYRALDEELGVQPCAAVRDLHRRILNRDPALDPRGYDPTGHALEPTEAVRGFLHALGVPPRQIPADAQAHVGLYRGLVAGERMLVVLCPVPPGAWPP